MVDSIDQERVFRCEQREEETCHETFVTVFTSHTEEKCEETGIRKQNAATFDNGAYQYTTAVNPRNLF